MILLEPTEELIELYGSFWRTDAKEWTALLHDGDDAVDVRDCLRGCSYSDIDHFLWVYGKLLKAERDSVGAQVAAGSAGDPAEERWHALRGIFNTDIEYKRPDSGQLP